MKKEYIEVLKVLNTHGVTGEIKCEVLCDDSEMLKNVRKLYFNNTCYNVASYRKHNCFLLVKLEDTDSVEAASRLKNIILSARRDDINLPEGRVFICDLFGLPVKDKYNGVLYGVLSDVLLYEPHKIFVIDTGKGEVLLPDVPEYVSKADADSGEILITPIPGFFD